jgi:hypothetical protein
MLPQLSGRHSDSLRARMIRRPLIHRLPEDSGLPRPQTCVPQFRSDRELGRSHWRPGSPILTRFHALLGISMSGHTRDTMAASLFMFAGVSMTMRLGRPFYGCDYLYGREPLWISVGLSMAAGLSMVANLSMAPGLSMAFYGRGYFYGGGLF